MAGANPVVSVLLAALFLGEKITLTKLLGALLVVAGVVQPGAQKREVIGPRATVTYGT